MNNKNNNGYDLNTIYYTLGRNIKKIYDSSYIKSDKKKSKIEDFAENVGISTSFAYHLFSGKNPTTHPSLETVLLIANTLNVPIDRLLENLTDEEYEDYYKSIINKK